jgi:phage-related protein
MPLPVMPHTKVIFYQESSGNSPVVDWFKKLRKSNPKAWANCFVRVEQLAIDGHELRRPASDMLRDGIRELRAKHIKVQYRILYFFHGQNVAVLAHSIVKPGSEVDADEIETAIERMKKFKANPKLHTYEE